MNAWDWSNVPWEPFCIVGLIFVCLGILGYSLQQQETIDRLKRENATPFIISQNNLFNLVYLHFIAESSVKG